MICLLLQGFLNYLQDVFPSLPLKLLKSEIDNGGLEEDIVNRLLDRQISPDHDMMDIDQGDGLVSQQAGEFKRASEEQMKVISGTEG